MTVRKTPPAAMRLLSFLLISLSVNQDSTAPLQAGWAGLLNMLWKPYFINDWIGKGLKTMLERENEMPEKVRAAVQQELKEMEKEDYIV